MAASSSSQKAWFPMHTRLVRIGLNYRRKFKVGFLAVKMSTESFQQQQHHEKRDVKLLEHVDETQYVHIDPVAERRLVRKLDIRLMPFTALIYLLCYIDRSNIGNAKILNSTTHDTLLDSTGLTTYEYTIALQLFLVTYTLFDAPSNLALKIFKPNTWLGFLIIGFGAISAAIGGTKNYATVAVLRTLLGAFEAGVFSGMIFFMSFWYKPSERATRIAIFLCSATLAGAFGGAIAFGVGHINRAHGLEGWRWLFIIEGVPSVALGFFMIFFLPNYPENAKWLSEEEKELEVRRLGANSSHGGAKLNWPDAKATLLDGRLWFHYFAYLCLGVGVSSLSLFTPTIVAGLGYHDLQAQLFTVPPYAVAYVITLGLGILSDRYKVRGLIAGTCFAIGSVSFIVQAALPGTAYSARYGLLVVSTTSVFGGLPLLCAWVSDNVLNTTSGSLASALNITFTGPGQIIGVWIYRSQDSPAFRLGHGVNAGFLALGLNKKLIGTSEPRWIA
ncbi:major facilitator superfamily domain-containing protein [Astrocystis sublimbata]|nr:major facilitator superfamily domain-containing protein [Astrocystis sublimbata]